MWRGSWRCWSRPGKSRRRKGGSTSEDIRHELGELTCVAGRLGALLTTRPLGGTKVSRQNNRLVSIQRGQSGAPYAPAGQSCPFCAA
jgi:hypothetical protein